jgi:hypothetical protein
LPDNPPPLELFWTGTPTAVDEAETDVDCLPSDPVTIDVTVTTD